MTDRELLTLAARAAGIECEIDEFPNGRVIGTNQYNEIVFDPLTDPGDALRLAVQLTMTIEIYGCGCMASGNDNTIRCDEFNVDDPLAATMRAITRAAAEIGRRMPE